MKDLKTSTIHFIYQTSNVVTYVILILFLTINNSTWAQENTHHIKVIQGLISDVQELSENNPAKAIRFADSVIALSQQISNDTLELIGYVERAKAEKNANLDDEALASLAFAKKIYTADFSHQLTFTLYDAFLMIQNDYQPQEAIESYKKAFEASQNLTKEEKLKNEAYLASNVAIAYSNLGQFDSSYYYLFKALSYFKNSKDDYAYSIGAGNLASTLEKLNDTTNAINYHREAIRFAQKVENKIDHEINFAVYLKNLSRFDSSLAHYKKAMDIANENKFYSKGVQILYNMAVLEKTQQNFDKAIALGIQTREQASSINLPIGKLFANHLLFNIYVELGDFEKAQEIHPSLAKNEHFFTGDFSDASIHYELLYIYYKGLNEIDSALYYLEKNKLLSDSIQSQANLQSLKKYQKEFETEKNKLENDVLKGKIKQKEQAEQLKNYQLLGLIVGILILLGIVLIVIRNQNRLKELNLQIINQKEQLDKQFVELKELGKTKEKLISSLAHDFRNRIAVTQGMTEALIDSKEHEKLSPDNKEFIELIHENAISTMHLVDELTTDAVLNQSLYAKKETVNVSALLNGICKSFEAQAKTKNISIKKQLTEATLLLHKDSLKRVIENLLSNALKYSNPNTTITVDANTAGKKVLISINDQGPGFTEEDMRKVFKSQGKLSAKPTAGEQSTGIGLTIVYNLIQNMGGTIELKTKLGKGSQFLISFPL